MLSSKIPYTGRRQIFIPKQTVTRSTLPELLQRVFSIHQINNREIRYLTDYYRGNQPVLQRTKDVRPEICHRMVENHAYEITAFKLGYCFGEPVQYVQRGKPGIDGGYDENNSVSTLNEYMALDGKDVKDRQLAENFFVCGTGYRMVLPCSERERAPFQSEILPPENTFVVYDTSFGKHPWLCGTYVEGDDASIYIGVYTEAEYFEVLSATGCSSFTVTDSRPHALHALPIIEYPANPSRLGCFEIVLSLMDVLNDISSNRMDSIEQFVQALMVFKNCDIDRDAFVEMLGLGAVKIKGEPNNPADIDLLAETLDQSQIQKFVDYLYQTMLTVAGVPDRQASAGGNTGQALIIGNGWANAESRAKDTELIFKESERRFLLVVLDILKRTTSLDESMRELTMANIDIKFTRNRTDNLLVKTQGLQNMLEAGVHPRIAFQVCGLFSDPEQVYVDSSDYLEKWLTKEATIETSNQKANPPQ